MQTNIVIVAGGLGTRFNFLSVFPKLLLPTPDSASVLTKQLQSIQRAFKDSDDEAKVYVVVNQIFFDQVFEYAKVNCLLDKIVLVKSRDTSGSFNTLYEIKDDLPDQRLLFVWSDLVIRDFSELLSRCSSNSDVIFTTKCLPCRFKVYSVFNSVANISEVPDKSGDAFGAYFLQDKSIFLGYTRKQNYDLIQRMRDARDLLDLKAFQVKDVQQFRDLDVYLQKMSAKREANQFQTRFFNKLTIDREHGVIQKEAIVKQYKHLIQKQIQWYEFYQAHLKPSSTRVVPKLVSSKIDDSHASMTLEFMDGYKPLHEVLDQLQANGQFQKISMLYQNLRKAVQSLNSLDEVWVPFQTFKRDLKKQVLDKVLQRCQKIRHILVFYDDETMNYRLNEALCRCLEYTKASEDYDQKTNMVKYSFCHGDLNGSNALVDPRTLQIRFVDPRGYFGQTKMHGWKPYQLAKLLYCLFGYDDFNLLPCVLEKIGLPKIRKAFTNQISKPKFLDKPIYKILVGVIYVALAGYISQDIMKANQAYLFGMDLLERAFSQEA